MAIKGNSTLTITPLYGIPDITPESCLDELILQALARQSMVLNEKDILVLAQKVISKAENCFINYAKLNPSAEALMLAEICGKDPQFVELILMQSKSVIRVAPGVLIVEHHSGFISANAGIDHSNIGKNELPGEKWALLIPEDADASAKRLRMQLKAATGKDVGVLIIDSHGRPWRYGTVGVSIGFAGLPSLVDLRGKTDLYGRVLEATVICAVDELAAAASLVMGQTDEALPVVHVRGFPYPFTDGNFSEIIRPKENDLFR
jgi:coenzyme F420-0:L-glutamate ligase/coenzyme F420-1:gamma-L-glutamate ligase